jgi:hypothetical protein
MPHRRDGRHPLHGAHHASDEINAIPSHTAVSVGDGHHRLRKTARCADRSSGGNALPNGIELPDLEQPPAVKEGAGGGPAVPSGGGGGGKSTEDQQTITDAGNTMTGVGGAILVGGAAAAATGVGAGAAPAMGVLGGFVVLLGQLVGFLANDPPQPHEQIVTFKRRVSPVPASSDPAVTALGIGSQQSVFTLVTTQGYLDALERFAGAQDARDLNWALAHRGVALQCRPAFAVDVATLAAALFAAGQSLKASQYDPALKAGGTAVKDWIDSSGVERRLSADLEKAGATPAETRKTIDLVKANPGYDGSAATLSAELTESSQRLHGFAQRLVK